MYSHFYKHLLKFNVIRKGFAFIEIAIRNYLRSYGILFLTLIGMQVLFAMQDQGGIQGDLALQESHNSTILAIDYASQSNFLLQRPKTQR